MSQKLEKSGLPSALQFVSQKQLAEILSTSERTIERWRVEGQGPKFVRVGRRPLYRISDVEEYARERTYASTSQAKSGC